MTNDFIPVHEPVFIGNEKEYLTKCIDTGWVSSEGEFVTRLEKSYAEFIGVNYGVAVSSGTAALETALYAIGIKPGDEIIMPSFTIISCALACIRLGAKPVLVDVDPETWTMDVSQVALKITKNTVAIMAVHIYGHPVNMDPLLELQISHSFKIIEDIAEAQGSKYFSKYRGGVWLNCGQIGDISATSFYANKIITTGEGGMVCSDDEEYIQRAKNFRNLCFGHENRYEHEDIGYNFRMSNLQAAVGLAQLEVVYEHIVRKKELAALYSGRLEKLEGIKFMSVKSWALSSYWMFCIMIDPALNTDAKTIIAAMKKQSIDCRPFFCGLHKQPALKNILAKGEEYPNTDVAHQFGLYLPSSNNLMDSTIERIVNTLQKCIPSGRV